MKQIRQKLAFSCFGISALMMSYPVLASLFNLRKSVAVFESWTRVENLKEKKSSQTSSQFTKSFEVRNATALQLNFLAPLDLQKKLADLVPTALIKIYSEGQGSKTLLQDLQISNLPSVSGFSLSSIQTPGQFHVEVQLQPENETDFQNLNLSDLIVRISGPQEVLLVAEASRFKFMLIVSLLIGGLGLFLLRRAKVRPRG